MDYALLKIIAQAQGANTLFYLNETVDVPAGEIPRRAVKKVLLDRGIYDAVAGSLGEVFRDPDFEKVDVNDPVTQKIFAQLFSAGVVTREDLDAINALGTKKIPRWESLGFATQPHRADIVAALSSTL